MRNKILVGSGIIGVLLAAMVLADVTGNLMPVSDGAYSEWSYFPGGSHWVGVSETTCNGNTNYVYTNQNLKRDSYNLNLSSVPDGSMITAIEIMPCASRHKNGNGSSVTNVFYRWNGANSSDQGNYSLNGTTPVNLTATVFSGLSLLKQSSSNLQVGVVLSSGNKGARVSRLATRVTYTPPAPPQPPVAPTNLSATPFINSSSAPAIALDWTDNSVNEGSFPIERSTDGVNFFSLVTVGANTTHWDDNTVQSGTTYYYRVRAWNNDGYSAYSNIASAIAPSPQPPVAPSNLLATFNNATSTPFVQLTWTDNSNNESGFKVERGNDGINFSELGSTVPNSTYWIDPAVVSQNTYYYRVRAFNLAGNSDYSNVASITIP